MSPAGRKALPPCCHCRCWLLRVPKRRAAAVAAAASAVVVVAAASVVAVAAGIGSPPRAVVRRPRAPVSGLTGKRCCPLACRHHGRQGPSLALWHARCAVPARSQDKSTVSPTLFTEATCATLNCHEGEWRLWSAQAAPSLPPHSPEGGRRLASWIPEDPMPMRGLTGHWSPSEVPTHCPVLSAAPSRRACTSAAEDRCSTDHPCSER